MSWPSIDGRESLAFLLHLGDFFSPAAASRRPAHRAPSRNRSPWVSLPSSPPPDRARRASAAPRPSSRSAASPRRRQKIPGQLLLRLDHLVDLVLHRAAADELVHQHVLVWPMRKARSVAWFSTAGFHQRSKWMTCEAAVRLRPAPPALSDRTKKGTSRLLEARTRCLRFFTAVSPCRTRPGGRTPRREMRRAARSSP